MEETRIIKPHHITLMNRKNGSITGIKDVISFALNRILLEPQCGMVTVKGHDLHVSRLSVEKGEIDIDGTIDGIMYSDVSAHAKKSGAVFARLFK